CPPLSEYLRQAPRNSRTKWTARFECSLADVQQDDVGFAKPIPRLRFLLNDHTRFHAWIFPVVHLSNVESFVARARRNQLGRLTDQIRHDEILRGRTEGDHDINRGIASLQRTWLR